MKKGKAPAKSKAKTNENENENINGTANDNTATANPAVVRTPQSKTVGPFEHIVRWLQSPLNVELHPPTPAEYEMCKRRLHALETFHPPDINHVYNRFHAVHKNIMKGDPQTTKDVVRALIKEGNTWIKQAYIDAQKIAYFSSG